MDWVLAQAVQAHPDTPAGRVGAGLRHIIAVRKTLPHLHASIESRVVASPDPRVLVLRRDHPHGVLLELYNFSEHEVAFPTYLLRDQLGEHATDAVAGTHFTLQRATTRLSPFRALWLLQSEAPQ